MKTLNKFFNAFLIITVFFSSCKEEEVPPETINSFTDLISSAGDFEDFEEKNEVEVIDQNTDTLINGEAWKCTVERHDIVDGHSDFPLFNPNSNVIYPGSLLQGKSLNQATPDVIVVKRAPGTISYDLINGNAEPSFYVEELTKSGVQTAMNSIIKNSPDALPANFHLSVEEVQSREQLALSIGLDINTRFNEVKSSLDFSTDKTYTRFLVKLNQTYYTMSWDLPPTLEDIFAPSVRPEDLSDEIGPGNPPVYISDVTYGRIFYMLIESTESSTKMRSAINASFGNFFGKVEGEVETSQLSELSNFRIKSMAYGGDAAGTLELTGVTDLSVIASRLANSTDILTAKPISYVVRSVKTNKIVAVKLATQYDVTNCRPAAPGKFEFLNLQSASLDVNPGYETFIEDANGDGINDIIINSLSAGKNQVQVLLGNESGIFSANARQEHPVSMPQVHSWTDYEMKVCDINGDGMADLVWNNMTQKNDYIIKDNTTYVALGSEDGNFEFITDPLVISSGWGSKYNFYLLDINRDGMDDILWNESAGSRTRIYSALSDSVSSFKLVDGFQESNIKTLGAWSIMQTLIGDVNGDGRDDLIWEDTSLDQRVLFGIAKENEPGKFDIGSSFYLFGYTHWKNYVAHIGDVNGDSRDDVILEDADPSRPESDYNPIWVGFSDGTKINKKTLTNNMGPIPQKDFKTRLISAVADINRDGKVDILYNQKDGLTNKVYVALAKAEQGDSNIFSFETATQEHPHGNVDWNSFRNPRLKDVNGDEKPDIIWIRPQQTIGVYIALAY